MTTRSKRLQFTIQAILTKVLSIRWRQVWPSNSVVQASPVALACEQALR